MSDFYTLMQDLKECNSDGELFTVAKDIMTNKSKYGLDDYQLGKLEQIGLQRYEQLERDRQEMFRNKKK